jgi:hypothetical protein
LKTLVAALQTALGKKTLQAYEMVFLDVDAGVWLTNAPIDVDYGGDTFTSVGAFLGFSEISEEQEFGVSEVTVSLSGLPMHDLRDINGDPVNLFSMFLEHEYIDKTIKIYRVFFDDDQPITDGVMLMFDGRCDQPTISEDPTGNTTISVRAVNQWIDFERVGGRKTNHNQQLFFFPGDNFFEYVKDSVKDLKWAPAPE